MLWLGSGSPLVSFFLRSDIYKVLTKEGEQLVAGCNLPWPDHCFLRNSAY